MLQEILEILEGILGNAQENSRRCSVGFKDIIKGILGDAQWDSR